jgi:hypothetical protein
VADWQNDSLRNIAVIIHEAELKARVTDYAVRDYQFNFDEKNKHKVDSSSIEAKRSSWQ